MLGWLVFIGILVLAFVPSNNEYDEVEENEEFENYSTQNNYSNNIQQNFDFPKCNTTSEVPVYKGNRGVYEYPMLVRVRGDKYARQEEIIIEAHNRNEAKQKARNMGYDIIRCS